MCLVHACSGLLNNLLKFSNRCSVLLKKERESVRRRKYDLNYRAKKNLIMTMKMKIFSRS